MILLLLLAPARLIAGGNPDVGLPKVDRLIKDRNYNEAIRELAVYMNENPDDFDGAQRRIRRIINLRKDYNDKAIELLLVLAQEPTNDKKKLDMITYMESLEKNPNAATRNFILETKAAAQFTYYRAKFDEIMTTGDGLIDSGSYVEAARKFTEGYVFYKQEFDDDNPDDLVARVNGTLGGIMSALGSYEGLQPSFVAAVNAYAESVSSGSIEASEAAYTVLSGEIGRLLKLRNQIAANGWFLQDSFSATTAAGASVTENSFLPFAYRFTLGRKTSARFEGVLGAMDAQFAAAMQRLEAATDGVVRNAWRAGFASLDAGSIDEGLAALTVCGRFARLGNSLSSLGTAITSRSETFGVRDYDAIAKRYDGLSNLSAAAVKLGSKYGEYLAYSAEAGSLSEGPADADSVRKSPNATIKAYSGYTDGFSAYIGAITSIEAGVSSLQLPEGYRPEFIDWGTKFSDSVSVSRLDIFRKSASFRERSVGVMLASYKKGYADALALLDGVSRDIGGAQTTVYYPAESIAALTKIRTGIDADRKAVEAALAELLRVPESALSDEQYAASIRKIRDDQAAMGTVYGDAAVAIARANSRVLQASLARQESDLRYAQAQAALKKQDFQSARDNLQRSREKVNQSLAFQESASFRVDSDKRLETLGADITRIENEAVVREVRSLISSGKNFYYLGNFDQAEQIFLQAKTRWAVTNIEPNAEVANWLDIINTALSMKTGRTIPVSAPLYPQMSQILSSANQLYSEGKALMTTGKRDASLAKLTEARSKLQQLQLVYPLNQDAGQLTLRINQLIDPSSFMTFFGQKVLTIRANYRIEKQTSYSDLLDLYQINPSYPGLKKLLDEVEIYLGVRIPPPDPKALARSAELTKAAQKIYDANNRNLFQVALDQLDEAIKLNPDNNGAIALKDRVQTAIGGKSVAVLSGEDEAKYQQAVQELQKGNKITASALVEQLLQNPKSRNSAKIQDLKKRIDSLL